jgi:hypothetical protein
MEIERPLMKTAMKDTDGIPAALRSGTEEETPTSHDHLDSQFGRCDLKCRNIETIREYDLMIP